MTPAGIEPATFRFVAQHLNHCATSVPIVRSNSIIHNIRKLTCVNLTRHMIWTPFFNKENYF